MNERGDHVLPKLNPYKCPNCDGARFTTTDQITGMPILHCDFCGCDESFDNWRQITESYMLIESGMLLKVHCEFCKITLPYHVRGIGEEVFADRVFLESVILPPSLETIGAKAFRNCRSLKKLIIPNTVTQIGDAAFANSGIEEIVLPEGIKKIEKFAFAVMPNLRSVTLPSALSSIGEHAFDGCEQLKTIGVADGSQNQMPASLKSIEKGAFWHCKSLKSFSFSSHISHIGDFAFSGSGIQEIVLPEGDSLIHLKEIGNFAFSDMQSLRSVQLTGYLEEIGIGAFSNCRSLKELTIPINNKHGVAHAVFIGNNAFEDCHSLKAIRLEATCHIAVNAFSKCDALEKIEFLEEPIIEAHAFDDCPNLHTLYIPSFDQGVRIRYKNEPWISYNRIPGIQTIFLKKGISYIYEEAFSGMKDLKTVVFPASLERIGRAAFLNCTGIEELVFPNALTTIEANAFEGCTSLRRIQFSMDNYDANKGVTIRNAAFRGCTALEFITPCLPIGFNKIAEESFKGCSALKKLNIEGNVIEIRPRAFADCAKLKKIRYRKRSILFKLLPFLWMKTIGTSIDHPFYNTVWYKKHIGD